MSLSIFCHRRVADVKGSLPKYSGDLFSQLAFGGRVTKALLSGRQA